jgi:pantetheine-phosphate adenylyltransferase
MRRALFPGTFDPLTAGHLDLMERALRIFDELVVAVAVGHHKSTLFTPEERVEMVRECTRDLGKVKVVVFEGLLVRLADREKADAVLRGIRFVSDFEYEFQMALMNRRLSSGVETVFMMPSEQFTYVNSTLIKEIAKLGGPIEGLVPDPVARRLVDRLARTGRRDPPPGSRA